jgi:hypothetical protein
METPGSDGIVHAPLERPIIMTRAQYLRIPPSREEIATGSFQGATFSQRRETVDPRKGVQKNPLIPVRGTR